MNSTWCVRNEGPSFSAAKAFAPQYPTEFSLRLRVSVCNKAASLALQGPVLNCLRLNCTEEQLSISCNECASFGAARARAPLSLMCRHAPSSDGPWHTALFVDSAGLILSSTAFHVQSARIQGAKRTISLS